MGRKLLSAAKGVMVKVSLQVSGIQYTVHFVAVINAAIACPCSYCSKPGHPVQLMVTGIADPQGRDWWLDETVRAATSKRLVATMRADKAVCTQATCDGLMRRDMDRWYREAGVEDDTEPPATKGHMT